MELFIIDYFDYFHYLLAKNVWYCIANELANKYYGEKIPYIHTI